MPEMPVGFEPMPNNDPAPGAPDIAPQRCSPATEYVLDRHAKAQMIWAMLKSYMLDECSLGCAAVSNADEKNLINLITNSLPAAPQSSAGIVSAPVLDALVLAEDVLSRAPFSTAIWPNGMHPQIGIDKIRDAIEAVQHRIVAAPQSSAGRGEWSCGTCGDRDVPEKFRVFGSCYKCAAQLSIDKRKRKIAQLEARLRDVVQGSWQPIETAPKDKPIMLCVAGFLPCVGRWWPIDSCWTSFDWEGHFESDAEMSAYVNGCSYEPTHWMPLLAGPSLPSTERADD